MGKIIPGLMPSPEDEEKHQKALSRYGWQLGFEYRVNTYDPGLEAHGKYCDICKHFHKVPYQDEIGYITKTKPLDVAKKWAKYHRVESFIERRPVKYHHKLGKKTYALGTYVDVVKGLGEWTVYKKITKFGKKVDIH